MRVLRDAQAAHDASSASRNPLAAAAPGSTAQADAYSVLGVAHDVEASDIKRRYMRLSLQIHPDKCLHKVSAMMLCIDVKKVTVDGNSTGNGKQTRVTLSQTFGCKSGWVNDCMGERQGRWGRRHAAVCTWCK